MLWGTKHYESLTKRQSSVWKSLEEQTLKNVFLQKSKVKIIFIIFYDSNGIIHKEFVPQDKTVNGD